MGTFILSAASFAAIVGVGTAAVGTATVGNAVALAGQRMINLQPTGKAEMWQIFTGDGTLEHVYIKIPGGCTGRDGKKITDKRTGKVIETWGFYFRPDADHGHKPMTGIIKAPDPLEGEGTRLVRQGSDSLFDRALSCEIKISMKHVPIYTWGDKMHKEYVCSEWANDMWNRALKTDQASI